MKANPLYLVPQKLEVGWYQDVPEEVYHSWPVCSNSSLSTIHDSSPAHLRYNLDHPEESTPAMILGTATHLAILQPDLFDGRYYRMPEGNGATTVVKEARAKAALENPGKIGLKADDYMACRQMATAVWENLDAQVILESTGQIEVSTIWEQPVGIDNKLLCKARIDKLSEEFNATIDIKTCRSAHPRFFSKDIYNNGYHRQGAMYLEGVRALGINAENHYIIAVEKDAPFATVVYKLEPDSLMLGRLELIDLMQTYRACEVSGQWPSYPEGLIEIGVPEWARRRLGE